MDIVVNQLPFETPFEGAQIYPFRRFAPLLPDPFAWGEWIFGKNTESFKSPISARMLSINGTPPSAPSFTPYSYLPFPFPNGLIPNIPDSDSMTQLIAYRKPVGVQRFLVGSLIGAAGGSGVIQLSSGQIQTVRRTPSGSNVIGNISASAANAAPGDIMVLALVDSPDSSTAYLHRVAPFGSAIGQKLLAISPSAGNSYYTSSSYSQSPELFGYSIFLQPLTEAAARQSMSKLLKRVNDNIEKNS